MQISDTLRASADTEVEALISEIGGAVAAVISTVDGFDVAARAQNTAQVSRMAAMASSISAIGSVVGQESLLGSHRNITIEAELGYVVMIEITHPACPMILSVVTTRSAVLGQALYCANRAAARLSKVL